MKYRNLNKLLSAFAAFALVFTLAGCSTTNNSNEGSQSGDVSNDQSQGEVNGDNEVEVRTVTIAYAAASRPMSYLNDDGEADGYEVQVLREIGELLPQYNFEFVAIPEDTDLLIGVETGKYDLGIKGAWITEERLEKFIFPQNPVGASTIGLLFRTEDGYSSLEEFGLDGGKLVPITPQSAQYTVIQEFNEENPEAAIELTAADSFSVGDVYRWVLEGRYDGYFATKTSYQRNIQEEESPYHEYNDYLSYFVYRSLPTWALFNRENQQLADDYDEAYVQLLESGRIAEIMYEYLGENTFDYLFEEEYSYLKP